jgi:hypothetical protein
MQGAGGIQPVFRSLAFSQPNPNAYLIEGAHYGATHAYPNLLPDQLANELELARQWGILPVELAEGIGDEAICIATSALARQECLYVVLEDGRMILIPSQVGSERTTHTMASAGADVIAAGQVLFGDDGKVRLWDHMSGHYRPHERQATEVAHAIFVLTGLR